MSAEGTAIYGNITAEEIAEALRNSFPDRKFTLAKDVVTKSHVQKLGRGEFLVGKLVPSETEKMLQTRLTAKEREHKEAEDAATKALVSIQTFHKQQQALFDEFVLLRQRYDEQKSATISILWTHCTKFHPDLRMIPTQEDPKTFSETEEQIGEYRVGAPLGEGQFATVKNCYLKNEDKEYALKIINKDRITSFTALMRVSTEIDNLKLLKNPYIVSVTQVIHTETKLYIITEKGGRDLFEFFDEHPDGVPEDWAKQIIACVLKGVMFCHDQGICHRGTPSLFRRVTCITLVLIYLRTACAGQYRAHICIRCSAL
jgi:serine/threonine protein kinase